MPWMKLLVLAGLILFIGGMFLPVYNAPAILAGAVLLGFAFFRVLLRCE